MKDKNPQHPTIQKIIRLCPDENLEVRINNNTSNLITAVKKKNFNIKKVSIHQIFLDAPEEIIEAVAHFLKNSTHESKGLIRKYIAANMDKLEERRLLKKKKEIVTQGLCYNLNSIMQSLNERYFGNSLTDIEITWGANKTATRKHVRTLNFGSYSYTEKLIRIHPVLDNYFVPHYFIEFIIYHEMLHALVAPKITENGHTKYHHSEFKKQERLFKYYEKSDEWQKRNLKILISMIKKPAPLSQFAFG